MSKPRVKIPKSAAAGEVITIKTLITHKMESGQRKDKQGNPIPRMIINSFECKFNGERVFSVDMEPAISANPYLQFSARVPEAGEFEFVWKDDEGSVFSTKKKIKVA
ncbi:thiosulfate oxidation carrier complex protein SoxZ [Hwanghaeella sp.]|uniref:thiosulfate oxidation carrier complex protein SoxZ n=1 Tax=Hwanghaeella sp. TaxID=2605943 RepID=UPI003CCB75BC